MPTDMAMSPCFAKITGIAVDGKDHVAGVVGENNAIEELFCVLECVDSGFQGLGGDGTDGTEEYGVDRMAKKEEFTIDLLDKFLAFLVK